MGMAAESERVRKMRRPERCCAGDAARTLSAALALRSRSLSAPRLCVFVVWPQGLELDLESRRRRLK